VLTSQKHLGAGCLKNLGRHWRADGVGTNLRLLVVLLAVGASFTLSFQHRAAAAPVTPLNPIQLENQQPGSTGWEFDNYNKENHHEIEGYASLTSVNQGGQISFMVSLSANAQYKMDIYRMGYYPQGTNPDGSTCSPCGGRLMQSIGPLSGSKQPTCPTTTSGADFGLTECQWASSYTLTVPTSWTTGNYIVKLTRLDDNLENYMTFVVRSDGVPADIVYSMDVTTWQAYNYWGGAGNNNIGYNLYGSLNDVTQGFVSDSRAYEVSFDRPYMDQGSEDGAGNFMVWDYPMIRWMEAQGYNVTYVTDVDLETNPSLFSGRKVFVNTGHDEYYSDNMRSNLQNAINSGVNLAFFSANNIGNRILWNPSSSGQPDREIYCDKGAFPNSTTGAFRYLTPPQPENALIGVMSNGVASGRPFLVADASNWIYAGTGLVNYNGTVVTSGPGQNAIKGLVGYEFDVRADDDPTLSDFVSYQPAGLHTLGHSFVPASDNGVNAWSDSTIYTASSGAMIFAAGTIQWSWGVDNGFNDGFCDCNLGYANTDSQIITANILNRFVGGPAPAVSLNPTSLNLGSVAVGTTSAAQSATLTNSGTADLTISAISVTGANASDFAQTNTCPIGPATLPANGTCTISVTFTPGAAGTRSASVSISDNAVGTPHALPLSGVGLGPVASLSTGSVNFGNETVGYTSAAQTVTLTNSGTSDLHISAITLAGTNPGDFAQTNTCPQAPSPLAANARCTISVTFSPTVTGARAASVQISDDAPGSPQSVALNGTGTTPAPAVSLSASSLSFGTIVIGNTSASQSVTLTNSGTAALTINSIGLGGTNPGDFAQTNTCPINPSTLAQNGTCTITVTFTPTSTGARTASVSIADNAANSPQSIALSGTGQNPTAPAVTLSPTSVNFGNVNIGSTSPAQSVKLTNSGNAALSISSIAITGTNSTSFAQTNTCPSGSSTLAAGASCTISVTFTPTVSGPLSASVSITDNAANSPQSVPLSGTGVTPSPNIFSDGFESGSLPGNWTGTTASSGNTVALDTSTYHSGTASFKATKLTGHGGDAYISKTFTDTSTVVDVRAYYYLSSFAGNGTLNIMELDTSAGYYLGSIEFVGNAGTPNVAPTLYWLDGGNYVEYACGNAPSLNAWHSFEIQDTVSNSATSGSFALSVDGTQVCAKTGIRTAQQAGAHAGSVSVGSITSDTGIGMIVNVDDVVVATSHIGP
jgi:hypothetical protein